MKISIFSKNSIFQKILEHRSKIWKNIFRSQFGFQQRAKRNKKWNSIIYRKINHG